MEEGMKRRKYDLEDRTLKFARDVRDFLGQLPKTILNTDDVRQLLRASGSIGANYIEANEALGKKDFLLKLRTSRKEAKESRFWLNLITVETNGSLGEERQQLLQEATELMNIFGAIVRKLE